MSNLYFKQKPLKMKNRNKAYPFKTQPGVILLIYKLRMSWIGITNYKPYYTDCVMEQGRTPNHPTDDNGQYAWRQASHP